MINEITYRPYRVYAEIKYRQNKVWSKNPGNIKTVRTLLHYTCVSDCASYIKKTKDTLTEEKLRPRVYHEAFPPIRECLLDVVDWEVVMEDASHMSYGALQEHLTVEEFVKYVEQFK